MAVAALVVSVIAILIALGSLIFTARADRRAHRAEQREVRREERDEEQVAVRRGGRPIATPHGGGGGYGAARVQHSYDVRNEGPATISDVRFWIIDEETGETISTAAGGGNVLAPGDPPITVGLEVFRPSERQRLIAQWTDLNGTHEKPAPVRPPQYH